VGIRLDPVSGMRVVVAPGRAHRPGAFTTSPSRPARQTPAECPFCAGHEDRTPPETLVLPADGAPWAVRVVPNLYPALEPPDGTHEVVVHAPAHVTAFADLSLCDVERVCEAWARRAVAHAAAGYRHLLCTVNDGPGSGASLDHTHSQLTAMALAPPLVAARLARFEAGCPVCAELGAHGAAERTISQRAGVRVYAPWASAIAYQLRAAPLVHASDAHAAHAQLAAAIHEIAATYARTLGPVPWNAWLHSQPLRSQALHGGDNLHWHVEAVPRVTVLASMELGAGLPICAIDPGDAARTMRSDAGTGA
jgi:UDPglucose--hexose-1-phosphate uridylyltransferase